MEQQKFSTVIVPKTGWFDLNLKEVLAYRDLILLFVKRDFVSKYKQTILGPVWAIIQPFLTTVMFTLIFGSIAGLAPGGIPSFVFYLSGNVMWGYFSGCLGSTANTFVANSHTMGKVYFPRLVMPVSSVLSQLISFAIQFVFFMGFLIFYWITGENVRPNLLVLMMPVFLLHMAMLSLGVGVIISALTTKYRDLAMVVGFGVQLWMYATPVAYDISVIPEKFMSLYMLNPVTPIITMFRYAFLGIGSPCWAEYGISCVVTFVVLILGIMMFNRVEKTFMDTV